MSSADLLRRAAAKLREHAKATTPHPWIIETWSHGWDDGQSWRVNGPTDEAGVTPCVVETHTDDAGQFSRAEADVAFVALMHPPVALALADLLDRQADFMRMPISGRPLPDGPGTILAVALAVLREPEGTRDA